MVYPVNLYFSSSSNIVLLFGSDFLAIDKPRGRRSSLYIGSCRATVSVHHRITTGAEGGEGSWTCEEVVHQAAAEIEAKAAKWIEHAGRHRVLWMRVPVSPTVGMSAEVWVRKTTITKICRKVSNWFHQLFPNTLDK